MTRPSTRCAVMVSSVTVMCWIRDSTLTAVLIPCLDDDRFVLQNQVPNLVEFARTEPMIPRERRRRQPELAMLPIAPNVDVHGLVAIETIEKEPVRSGNPRN